MKRKMLIIILIYLLAIPFTAKAQPNYLYDVLKDEAENGGLAKEYIGAHQDSPSGVGTSKIYAWNLTTSDEGTTVKNEKSRLNFMFVVVCLSR